MTKISKATCFILFFLLLLNCKSFEVSPTQKAETLTNKIEGRWTLKSVSKESPDKININSWQIEFFPDGKWSYSGSMSGQFEGMELKGSGKYKISDNKIEYTAGENKGISEFEIKNDEITLNPDPIVKPNGTDDAITVYKKLK